MSIKQLGQLLNIATTKGAHIESSTRLEKMTTSQTSFIQKFGLSKLTLADCSIDEGFDLNRVVIDQIEILLTRCSYSEYGIRTSGSVLQTSKKDAIALQILNDSRLPFLSMMHSVIDGCRILDQRSKILIDLGECIFRKSFNLSLVKDAECDITLRRCTFIGDAELFVTNNNGDKSNVDIKTDQFSSHCLRNSIFPFTVMPV